MFRSPAVDAIVVLIIVLLILGPKRLPAIGKGLGSGMREFKEGITGESKDDDDEAKPTLSSATPMPGSTSNGSESPAASGTGAAGSERRSG